MKVLIILAGLLFAMASAHAQPNFGSPPKEQKLTPAQQKEQDEAYKSSLKRIPAKETPVDPWGSARGANETSATPQGKPKKQ
jgi:hypothetical protein